MRFILSLFLSLALMMPITTMAQEETAATDDAHSTVRLAVLDVNAILTTSKAAESIKKQLAKQRDKYQKEIGKHEKKLKGLEKKLIELKKENDAEGFAEKGKEFKSKMQEAQKKMTELKGKLDKGYGKAMAELREEIINIVATIAEEEKFDLVISRQEVVIVSKEIDITESVMTRLNKELPKLSLSFK